MISDPADTEKRAILQSLPLQLSCQSGCWSSQEARKASSCTEKERLSRPSLFFLSSGRRKLAVSFFVEGRPPPWRSTHTLGVASQGRCLPARDDDIGFNTQRGEPWRGQRGGERVSGVDFFRCCAPRDGAGHLHPNHPRQSTTVSARVVHTTTDCRLFRFGRGRSVACTIPSSGSYTLAFRNHAWVASALSFFRDASCAAREMRCLFLCPLFSAMICKRRPFFFFKLHYCGLLTAEQFSTSFATSDVGGPDVTDSPLGTCCSRER